MGTPPSTGMTALTFANLSIRQITSSILDIFRPEILQDRTTRPPILGPTAWLNGLRGWAALLVVIMHLTAEAYNRYQVCYGAEIDIGVYNTDLIAWPVFRLLFTGGQMAVTLFLVISGYVGTKRLLSLLHQNTRSNTFVDELNSVIFRRPFRLYLPVIWSTLAFISVQHAFGIARADVPMQPTFFRELKHWSYDILQFLYVYKDVDGPPITNYNFHSWTISVEFRSSILLLFWLFALRYATPKFRVILTLVMTLYLIFGTAGALYASSFAGMLTAELDLLNTSTTPGTKLPWILRAIKQKLKLRRVLLYAMFFSGLYLVGQPSDWDGMNGAQAADNKERVLSTCYGWQTLSKFIPPAYNRGDAWHQFWLFWSSWMLFVSIKETNIRRICESRFSQYLGRHSFSLYLTHGPLIGIVSSRLFYLTGVRKPYEGNQAFLFQPFVNKWHDMTWWPLPDIGPYGMKPNFLFCGAVSVVVFLYAAEIGTKIFDAPSVYISKRMWLRLRDMGESQGEALKMGGNGYI